MRSAPTVPVTAAAAAHSHGAPLEPCSCAAIASEVLAAAAKAVCPDGRLSRLSALLTSYVPSTAP